MAVIWDKRNLRTVSTHLRVHEALALRRVCDAHGTTPYALVRAFLLHYIATDGGTRPIDA